MNKEKRIMFGQSRFRCDLCRISFPTGWQLRRHDRSTAHHRVARAAQPHNNIVVAPKTSLSPQEVAPTSVGSGAVPQQAEVYVGHLWMPPRKLLLYGTLAIVALLVFDYLSKHRIDTTTKVKFGSINLIVPTGIAALLGYLAVSKITRAEITGWLRIGHSINRFFSNWSKL